MKFKFPTAVILFSSAFFVQSALAHQTRLCTQEETNAYLKTRFDSAPLDVDGKQLQITHELFHDVGENGLDSLEHRLNKLSAEKRPRAAFACEFNGHYDQANKNVPTASIPPTKIKSYSQLIVNDKKWYGDHWNIKINLLTESNLYAAIRCQSTKSDGKPGSSPTAGDLVDALAEIGLKIGQVEVCAKSGAGTDETLSSSK